MATVNPKGPGFRSQTDRALKWVLCHPPTHCPVLGSLRYVVGPYPIVAGLPKGAAPLPSKETSVVRALSIGRKLNHQTLVRFLRRVGQPQSPGFGPSAWLQTLFSVFSRKEESPRVRVTDETRATESHVQRGG